jgi:hypothetical protein
MITPRRLVALAATVTLSVSPLALAAPAEAATKAVSYKNCTALNKVYKHGVAKKGAKDKVKGKTKPVTNFKVSTSVYQHNDGKKKKYKGEKDLDRDNDGVACEKR